MPDQEFFTGPPLLQFYAAQVVTGAGATELAGLSVRYRPNGTNNSMLDILEPKATEAQVGGQLDGDDLVQGSDVWIYQFASAILFDVKSGRASSRRIGNGEHLIWVVPGTADGHN